MSLKTKRTYLFYLLSIPTVAFVTVILRTVALLRDYDVATGYFRSPALPVTTVAILVAATVILALFTHELRELFVFSIDYKDLPTLFSGLFLAAALLFFAIFNITVAKGESILAIGVAALASLAALIGASAFAVRAFDGRAQSAIAAMLILPLAFLGVLVALYLYFENTMRINEPNKVLTQYVLAMVSFFFLGEARIALGRAKWALHTCITALTALSASTVALPDLIYHAARGESVLGNTMLDFVLLAVALYAMARLFSAFASALRQSKPETLYVTDFNAASASAPAAEDAPQENAEEIADEEATDR